MLNDAFIKIKPYVKGHVITQEAFYDLRDDISLIVKNCAKNIKVVVYFDFVLDKPLIVSVGRGENRLVISIKKDGRIKLTWTKETWAKYFADIVDSIKFTAKTFVKRIYRGSQPKSESVNTKESITFT